MAGNVHEVWGQGTVNELAVQFLFREFHRCKLDIADEQGRGRPGIENSEVKAYLKTLATHSYSSTCGRTRISRTLESVTKSWKGKESQKFEISLAALRRTQNDLYLLFMVIILDMRLVSMKTGGPTLPPPLYAPDPLTINWRFFTHHDHLLCEKCFKNQAETETAFNDFIASKSPIFVTNINKLKLIFHWPKYVDSSGYYLV